MEGFKLWSIERFGEDVCFFIVYVYEFKTHNSFFHQVSNEMVTYLYVLRFWILDRVLRKIYDTGVITENTHCILRNSIVMKQLLHPKKLCAATSSGYVLCFSCRERHEILFLAHPWDKIVTKVEAASWSTFLIVHTTSPVCIWIPSKASIWVFWIPQTIIWSSIDISYNSLHRSQAWFLWSSLISSTNTNIERNIRSTSYKIE